MRTQPAHPGSSGSYAAGLRRASRECGSGDHEPGGIFKNNLVTSAVPNVVGDVSVLNSRARDHSLHFCAGLTACTTGAHDFFGHQVPAGGAVDIGAGEAG